MLWTEEHPAPDTGRAYASSGHVGPLGYTSNKILVYFKQILRSLRVPMSGSSQGAMTICIDNDSKNLNRLLAIGVDRLRDNHSWDYLESQCPPHLRPIFKAEMQAMEHSLEFLAGKKPSPSIHETLHVHV